MHYIGAGHRYGTSIGTGNGYGFMYHGNGYNTLPGDCVNYNEEISQTSMLYVYPFYLILY